MSKPQVRILTEEHLNIILRKLGAMLNAKRIDFEEYEMFDDMRISHKDLLSANASLSFENMLRKKYEGFLLSVIRSGEKLNDGEDYEWFKHHMGSSSILSEVYK
jgi:hypothetical protein